MTIESVIVILFSLLILYSDAQQIFVEENDPFMYLVCPANISFNTLNLVNTSSSEPQRPLVTCFSPQCKTYTGAVTLTLNNTHYIFQITRPSVYRLRGLTQVRCVYNDTLIGSQYEILVYAKPQTVTCDPPLLTNNNTSVSVTCTASKVYPKAGCEATLHDMVKDFPVHLSFINNPMYVDSVEYYISVCNWTSLLNNFVAGNYSLNVTFYLQNITQYSIMNMSTIASFNFSQPKSKLSSECFNSSNISDGFIRPDATFSCLCFLDSFGYPPGSVQWFYKDREVGISVSSSASLLQIGPTNNTMEYNCSSSTSLKNGNSFLNYIVKYANATNITKFTIDNPPSYIGNGTNIKLICEADGNPPPFITIWKSKSVLSQNISGYSVLLERTMTCRDTGIYECQAYNGNRSAGSQVIQKYISILVHCPLQMNHTTDSDKHFSLKVGQSFVETFTIYGYPEPNNIAVSKSDSTSNNFNVKYQPNELPYFIVELKIENVKKSDFGNYTAIIYQGGNQNLHYSFSLSEAEDISTSKTEINIGAAVGGSIAAVIVIIIIIIAVFFSRKYKIIVQKKTSTKQKKIQNYSELTVTQQPQDRHNYETPNINLETETTNNKSNYVNVLDVEREYHPYDQITNDL